MNYQLAKRLKNAGFVLEDHYVLKSSKKDRFNTRPYIHKNDIVVYKGRGNTSSSSEIIPVPTLSELIDACLELDAKRPSNTGHISINRSPHVAKDGKVWFAQMLRGEGNGETVEEAVAELWLALNTK